ncbi:MAG: DUF2637 domain-containing protein [Georgenia sp.]
MTTHVITRHTGRQWAVLTAVSGTVFIAAGAFWLSFTALADLAVRSGIGAGQAWAWPLIVDGIIVVATVAVVALAGQKAAWYPWTLLIGGALMSVTANAIHAIVTADADVPDMLAAAVAAVPPVVLLAITHLTVILTRPLPGADEATSTTELAPGGRPSYRPEAVSAEPEVDAISVPLPGESQPVPAPGAGQTQHSIAGLAAAKPESAAPDRRDRADTLREQGWSNKHIARELDVHPSTVGRWFASAHLPDTTDHTSAEEAKDS